MSTSRPPLRNSYEGLMSQAQSAAQSGDIDGAIALLRRVFDRLGRLSDRVLDRRPDLRGMHLQAGILLTGLFQAEGRFSEAHGALAEVLDKHPEQAGEWSRELASLRIAKGEVEAGLANLSALAEETPNDPAGWLALGTEARIEGRLAESQEALDQALEVSSTWDPETQANCQFARFLLFKEMGQQQEALAAWEEAVRLHPDMADTVRQVYTMLTDAGLYAEAQRFVARDQNPLQAGFQRGLMAQLTGDPSRAREEWERVAALDPTEFESGHDSWAEAVLRLGDPEPALLQLQEMLAEDRTPRLFVLAGIGWAMKGDRELAGSLLQQAINFSRWERPPKQKLDSADWRLLDSLVADDEVKTPLKAYFAVIETVWG